MEAHDYRKRQSNQLRIGLPSARAKDIINLSTRVEQVTQRGRVEELLPSDIPPYYLRPPETPPHSP